MFSFISNLSHALYARVAQRQNHQQEQPPIEQENAIITQQQPIIFEPIPHIIITPRERIGQQHRPATDEIGRLVQNRESSMQHLSSKETTAINLLSNRYAQSVTTQGGAQRVLEQTLKPYLENKFQNILPEQLLLNTHHIAYRYLFLNINPMISPNAMFTIRNAQNVPIAGKISDEHKLLMAYQWLATEDSTFNLPEDYNQEQMKEFIVAQLALIARAHNWDKTRVNAQGKQEEYDDGELDKPSCTMGVKKRLTQILDVLLMNAGPEYRTLSAPVIKRHYQEHVVTGDQPGSLFKKIDNLSIETLKKVSEGFDVFIDQGLEGSDDEMSEDEMSKDEQKAALNSFKENLSVTDEAFQAYLEQLKAYFGPERITGQADPKPRDNNNTSYHSYAEFAEHLRNETLTLFGEILKTKITKTIERKPQQQEEKPENSHPAKRSKTEPKGVLTFSQARQKNREALPTTAVRVKRRRQATTS